MAAKSNIKRSANVKKSAKNTSKAKAVSKTAKKIKPSTKSINVKSKPIKIKKVVKAAPKAKQKPSAAKTKVTSKPVLLKAQSSKSVQSKSTPLVKKIAPKVSPSKEPKNAVSSKSKTKTLKSTQNVKDTYASLIHEDLNASKAKPKVDTVLAITNSLPKNKKDEISLTKIASIAQSLTNVPKSIPGYAVKTEKEPPGKFEMEFVIRASGDLIYEFFSTPSGLSEWFCDDLNIRNGVFTFIWDDQIQQARLLKTIDGTLARFQWVEKTDGSYFEFRIQKDDLTNDISLIITDFADTPSDLASSKKLWQSQIEKLMQVLGSVY